MNFDEKQIARKEKLATLAINMKSNVKTPKDLINLLHTFEDFNEFDAMPYLADALEYYVLPKEYDNEEKYKELLAAVKTKTEGLTRHGVALNRIRLAENDRIPSSS